MAASMHAVFAFVALTNVAAIRASNPKVSAVQLKTDNSPMQQSVQETVDACTSCFDVLSSTNKICTSFRLDLDIEEIKSGFLYDMARTHYEDHCILKGFRGTEAVTADHDGYANGYAFHCDCLLNNGRSTDLEMERDFQMYEGVLRQHPLKSRQAREFIADFEKVLHEVDENLLTKRSMKFLKDFHKRREENKEETTNLSRMAVEVYLDSYDDADVMKKHPDSPVETTVENLMAREQYIVTITPEGKVERATWHEGLGETGRFITYEETAQSQFGAGTLAMVIQNDVMLAKPKLMSVDNKWAGNVQHSTLSGGEPVMFAGVLVLDKEGKVESIGAWSGHYPTHLYPSRLWCAIKFIEENFQYTVRSVIE